MDLRGWKSVHGAQSESRRLLAILQCAGVLLSGSQRAARELGSLNQERNDQLLRGAAQQLRRPDELRGSAHARANRYVAVRNNKPVEQGRDLRFHPEPVLIR